MVLASLSSINNAKAGSIQVAQTYMEKPAAAPNKNKINNPRATCFFVDLMDDATEISKSKTSLDAEIKAYKASAWHSTDKALILIHIIVLDLQNKY